MISSLRRIGVALLWLGFILSADSAIATETSSARPGLIPVILDTDNGDTWALALLLKSPELDLKLAVGDYGQAQYRARLLAKFLERAGRSDVPLGIGLNVAPHGAGKKLIFPRPGDEERLISRL